MTKGLFWLRSAARFITAQGKPLPPFIANDKGATAAVFALMLPVLIGAAAIAIDVGVWSVKSRQAQGVADQAAFSAAVASSIGANGTTEARAIAAGLGFANGVGGVTVNVSNPPTSGTYSGNTNYWQVTVQQPQSLGLAGYFTATSPNVVARAVAGIGGTSSCIIALSPNAANAVRLVNNAQMANSQCGVHSNSSSTSAIRCDNNCVLAGSLYAVGKVSWGNAKPTGTINESQPAFTDPYAGVSATPPTGMTCKPQVTNGGNYTPGRFCTGFNLTNSSANKTINLAPGVYYIEQRFNLTNNFTFNGTGVTLVFSVPTSSNFAIGNGNTFNLTAPTSGTFSGLAIMSVVSTYPFVFGNNNNINIQGAFYIPNQQLVMNNNLNSNLCTQLVARTVELANNGTMKSSCPGSGIKGIGGGTIKLVE